MRRKGSDGRLMNPGSIRQDSANIDAHSTHEKSNDHFPNQGMQTEDFMEGRPCSGYLARVFALRLGVLWMGVLLTAAVEAQVRRQHAKKFQSRVSTASSPGPTPEAAAASFR